MIRRTKDRFAVLCAIAAMATCVSLAGSAGCAPEETAPPPAEPAATPPPSPPAGTQPPAAPSAKQPAPADKTAASAAAAPDSPKVSLTDALADALAANEIVHFTPTDNANWAAKIELREAIWREDQLGPTPCLTGDTRGRPLVQAVAARLSAEHLHQWVEGSLEIAKDPERVELLRQRKQDNKPRMWLYPAQLIAEAAYNVSRDEDQKRRAIAIWEELEDKRLVEAKASHQRTLALLEQKEKDGTLDVSDKMELDWRRKQGPEGPGRRTIGIWDAAGGDTTGRRIDVRAGGS